MSTHGTPPSLDPSDRLHLLLGRLVHAFGRFDFTMGLQLKWLGPHRGVEVEHLLVATKPFTLRFAQLEPLVLDVFGHQNDQARQEFKSWFEKAKRFKAIRNDYAHGRWSVSRGGFPDGPTIYFMPLNWEMDPEKQPKPQRVLLDEFEREVLALEQLFGEYWELEKRYTKQARPSAAWEHKLSAGE